MEAQHRPEQTAKLPQAQESVIASQGQSVVEDLDMSELNLICTSHSHERIKFNSHKASVHTTIDPQTRTHSYFRHLNQHVLQIETDKSLDRS